MSPHDFLELANEWITGTREAEWRSAVSRAYYAAFHVACDLLRSCGFHVPQADRAHAYVWLRLCGSGHPLIQDAGNNLNHLRRIRNWSDYDLGRFLNHGTAFGQIQAAESIVQLLESVATNPPVQTQITNAMKIYERDVLGEVTWHP